MSIPYPSSLKTAEVVEAGRQRQCRHNPLEHIITKGTKLLVIHVPDAYGTKEMGYCADCAAHIINQGQRDLIKLEGELGLRRSLPRT